MFFFYLTKGDIQLVCCFTFLTVFTKIFPPGKNVFLHHASTPPPFPKLPYFGIKFWLPNMAIFGTIFSKKLDLTFPLSAVKGPSLSIQQEP